MNRNRAKLLDFKICQGGRDQRSMHSRLVMLPSTGETERAEEERLLVVKILEFVSNPQIREGMGISEKEVLLLRDKGKITERVRRQVLGFLEREDLKYPVNG